MKIIDTHVHLWDLTNNINNWVIHGNEEYLKRNYTIDDYYNNYPDSTKMVTIEAADGISSLAEVKWIHEHVKVKILDIKHIAYINMTQEPMQFEDKLSEFEPYNFVIGFRDIMSFSQNSCYSPCDDVTLDKLKLDNLQSNLETLAKNNYIFNCQMYPHQLLRVKNIIVNSKVKCIIDHCGLPEFVNTQTKNEWLDVLQEYGKFAKFKISGIDINSNQSNIFEICLSIVTHVSHKNIFFGSNFPVSDKSIAMITYNILRTILSENELSDVLLNNVENFLWRKF